MTITEAIQKSIEGGYKKDDKSFIFAFNADFNIRSSALLDPLFWQALGKAMGWTETEQSAGNWDDMKTMTYWKTPTWKYEWHHLISHLAEGGTIESYFAELK